MQKNTKEYWELRAKTYPGLDDIKSSRTSYKIANIIKSLPLSGKLILDVGCGPGHMAKVIRENIRHSKVVGIDLSESMIEKANRNIIPGLFFNRWDFLDEYSAMNVIKPDAIVMSLFLHHLTKDRDRLALNKAANLLAPHGWIVVAEAVPPKNCIVNEYERIFALKEDRNTYTLECLKYLLHGAGFGKIDHYTYRFKNRMMKWLDDPSLPKDKKEKIIDLHYNASKEWKEAYNQVSLPDGDIELNCKMVVVVGKRNLL